MIDRMCAELGTVLVGFGARRFDDSHVAEWGHGLEEGRRRVGVEGAVDEPEERRAT